MLAYARFSRLFYAHAATLSASNAQLGLAIHLANVLSTRYSSKPLDVEHARAAQLDAPSAKRNITEAMLLAQHFCPDTDVCLSEKILNLHFGMTLFHPAWY